jgi:hypothetical protein
MMLRQHKPEIFSLELAKLNRVHVIVVKVMDNAYQLLAPFKMSLRSALASRLLHDIATTDAEKSPSNRVFTWLNHY